MYTRERKSREFFCWLLAERIAVITVKYKKVKMIDFFYAK